MYEDNERNRIRERIVLAIYSLYSFALLVLAFVQQWENWIAPLVLSGVVSSYIMHRNGYPGYVFRAYFVAVMSWICISIYTMRSCDFAGGFSIMTAIIVMLAVYCIPKLISVSFTFFTAYLLAQLLWLHDLDADLSAGGGRVIMQIVIIYTVQYITFRLTLTQAASNEQMLESLASIREAQRSKDDFMANVSHEIRTPIHTVCGLSEAVLREDLSDEVREEICGIQTAGRSLLSIVSDILDFTELSSGKMEIIPSVYNITSTVNDILNMSISGAEEKGLELIVDCDAHIPSGLVGDEQKIRRAVMNLLDNAVKFTKEGGIRLSFSFREESYGVNLVVAVQDTGIGMKEEEMEKVFTLFNQADTRRNRQESGLGLGLAITKVIVNKMGGFLSVQSEYGKGTRMQLTIPQKVAVREPIVSLHDPEKIHVLLYLDMNKYQYSVVRDGYAEQIGHIVSGLGIRHRQCRSLAELKRCVEGGQYTHIFIAWMEYCEDKAFFEGIAKSMHVVLVLDRDHKEDFGESGLLCVYKPFYVLSIAAVFNGEMIRQPGEKHYRRTAFTAPDASILVVDDNRMNLRVAEGLLRPYRIRLSTAESGRDALEKLRTLRPDMVLMDHMMPEMDGVETLRKIRREKGIYFQNVPVVALTANAVGGAREMFMQEGFSEYLTKPIELSALERVLRRFLPENMICEKTQHTEYLPEQPMETPLLPIIEGVDTDLGMRYCNGNAEDYLDVLRMYCDIGISRIEELRRCCEQEEWMQYTILVHAVKSTSLGIGAAALSKLAENLENAAKNRDGETIRAGNEEMLTMYKHILEQIRFSSSVYPDEKQGGVQLRDLTQEEFERALERLSTALETYEPDAVSACLNELEACNFQGEPMSDMLSEVKKLAGSFDFADAGAALVRLHGKVRKAE